MTSCDQFFSVNELDVFKIIGVLGDMKICCLNSVIRVSTLECGLQVTVSRTTKKNGFYKISFFNKKTKTYEKNQHLGK